jgi:hypothetical protein
MGYAFRFFGREALMPWKEYSVMEERLRFVARLLDGEAMSDVCREFGISRKTGYKILGGDHLAAANCRPTRISPYASIVRSALAPQRAQMTDGSPSVAYKELTARSHFPCVSKERPAGPS